MTGRPSRSATSSASIGDSAGKSIVVFGVGVLWGTSLMVCACGQMFLGPDGPLAAPVTASAASGVLLGSALLPLAAYLLFLLGLLALDLCRAVLGLPGKLDTSVADDANTTKP